MSPELLAVAEEHEGGNGLHTVLRRCLLVLVHIHFDNAQAVAQLLFQVLQYRVHSLARATPGGEEIDQYEAVGRDDIVEGFHILDECIVE